MEFRNWILEKFTPVVMVVPSNEAEALVAEHNGLTIVDMLRPYGYFHHLSGETLESDSSRLSSLGIQAWKFAASFLPPRLMHVMQFPCELLESSLTVSKSSSFASTILKTCMLPKRRYY